MGEKGGRAVSKCPSHNYKTCEHISILTYAKFKLLTRVIKGGKENSVLSWSHFPFRMSTITSGKGTALAATYNVDKTKTMKSLMFLEHF